MTIFDFPRIHVRGTHLVNTGTGNNDSASPGEELSITCNTERVQPVLEGRTDAEYLKWMRSTDEAGLLRSQWNYYGDMSFKFIDVRVRSIQLNHNYIITRESEDALIGSRIFLNHAIMCDTNPEGFDSTQIFAESLQINATHALKNGTFISRKPSKGTTKSLNWFRNVSYNGPFGIPPNGINGELSSGGAGGASASFEHYIEILPEDITESTATSGDSSFHKLIGLTTSPAISSLLREVKNNGFGIVFRYNLYLCSPIISDTELARRFESGEALANPAYGKLVGTISPLYRGEEKCQTMGRFLKPCNSFDNPYRPNRKYYIAPVIAHYNDKNALISLDLSNTFPEDGPDGNKFNLGDLTLGIRKCCPEGTDPITNQNEIWTLGQIINNKSNYQTMGGMTDFDLKQSPSFILDLLDNDAYELILNSSLYSVLASESEYMVSASSVCNYLDELGPNESWNDDHIRERLKNEKSPSLKGEIQIFALRRGREILGPIEIEVEQWKLTPTGTPNEYGLYKYPDLVGKDHLVLMDGVGTYRIAPSAGSGIRRFRFVPNSLWPKNISPKTLAALAFQEFFMEVRVLPFDDYSKIHDNDLNFSLIYQEIFRYYHLIFPAMSMKLDMSDPAIWTAPTTAQYVLRMINPRLWDCHDYMPRTRDLSKSRRDLLIRFCELVLRSNDIRYESNKEQHSRLRIAPFQDSQTVDKSKN